MIPATNYIHIEYWMTELGLRPVEVWIYAIIHGFCQDGISTYRGSQRYFREWTHAARSTVIEALNDLKAKKLIVVRETRIRNITCNEYYTVASRSAYQNQGEDSLNKKQEFKKNWSEKQTPAGTENRHTLSEKPTSPCLNSGPNNIADNKFNNAADSIGEKYDGAAAALIAEKINVLFGKADIFDSEFVYEIEKALFDSGVGEKNIDAYLQAVFEKTVAKHPSSIPGLFRKLACAPDVVQDFVLKLPSDTGKSQPKEVECPVCEKKTHIVDCCCENCGFDITDFKNERKIVFQKSINALTEAERNELDKEISESVFGGNFMTLVRPDKIRERNEKLAEIYARYGIKYVF